MYITIFGYSEGHLLINGINGTQSISVPVLDHEFVFFISMRAQIGFNGTGWETIHIIILFW